MIIFTALAAAAAASPTGTVSSYHPQGIIQLLQEEGYKAKLTKDSDGDPMIETASGGSNSGSDFQVVFYGCEKHIRCADVQFSSAYDTDGKIPTIETVNKWNADNRWGRAYLDDESDPILEMDVNFAEGQLPSKSFLEQFERFRHAVDVFEAEIEWNSSHAEESESCRCQQDK